MNKVQITFEVSVPNYRLSEAQEALLKAKDRIVDFANNERQRLLREFPPDDYAQDIGFKKGCCGQ